MRGTVVIARCSGSDQLNSTASTRTLKVRITHVVAAMNTGTPNPRSTARLVVPIAAAMAYSEPTCMSAMGRLSSRSRRIDPPTAAAIDAAREELTEIGALDADGRITASGKRLRSRYCWLR